MSDSDGSAGLIERTFTISRRMSLRLDLLCEESGRTPDELLTEAIRLLAAGGVPAAPASVGGTIGEIAGPELEPLPPLGPEEIDHHFGDVLEEAVDSRELHQRFLEIMKIVEAKDLFTNQHSRSVSLLALRLAERIGISNETVLAIELAGLVHDLGKLRLPDEVLGKKGRLSPAEWNLVKRYPEFGADILERFANLGAVAEIVRNHQERWDGSGYPAGLQGSAIPVGSQVVAIADVYHVLTSDRAYRPALSEEVARRTIQTGIGRLWNPEVAREFLELVLA